MINTREILNTIEMIKHQCLDIRTITLGISLKDCMSEDMGRAICKIKEKILRKAENLVKTGEEIEAEFGIPIVNKRISVTPISIIGEPTGAVDYAPFAVALDEVGKEVGVDFIGGFSALVHKGMTPGEKNFILSIPEALSKTDIVCSSVNVGTTRAGINMDAVALMGRVVKEAAERTADKGGIGAAKLVVFCNAVEDNPFMAGGVSRHRRGRLRGERGRQRPGGCICGHQGYAGREPGRNCRADQENGVSHHPHGRTCGQRGFEKARGGIWHCGPFACADPGPGRQRRPDTRSHGHQNLRRLRHDGGAGAVKRRGQEGGRDGQLQRGRVIRRVYPGERGRGA